MASMVEMVEAHLLNVQREVQTLNERKTQIDQEITRLQEYLRDGSATLEEAKTPPATPVAETSPQTSLF